MDAAGRDRARAIAFDDRVLEGMATEVVPFRWGKGLFNGRIPSIWDHNFLKVDDVPADFTFEALRDEANRLHEAKGHKHRSVMVRDPDTGAGLQEGFRSIGWTVERLLMMALRRDPDRVPPDGVASEVDWPAVAPARRAARKREWWATDDSVLDQMRDKDEMLRELVGTRYFGASHDGTVASLCELYSDGSTAQVEDVGTLEEHRGHGLARAVVWQAIAAAKDAGCDFIFLIADDDDWPKEMYRKLGFDDLGVFYTFRFTIGRDPNVAGPK